MNYRTLFRELQTENRSAVGISQRVSSSRHSSKPQSLIEEIRIKKFKEEKSDLLSIGVSFNETSEFFIIYAISKCNAVKCHKRSFSRKDGRVSWMPRAVNGENKGTTGRLKSNDHIAKVVLRRQLAANSTTKQDTRHHCID